MLSTNISLSLGFEQKSQSTLVNLRNFIYSAERYMLRSALSQQGITVVVED